MKLNNVTKGLVGAAAILACSAASAGISATSYLEVNSLFVEIDTDNDGIGDVAPANLGDFITIISETREGNVNASYAGTTDGSNVNEPNAAIPADSAFVCVGPDCGSVGVGENTAALGSLEADSTKDYALGDMTLTGSALALGASGFTYADIGITRNETIANAGATIFNNLLTSLTIEVIDTVAVQFTGLYDLFVDSFISPDLTTDGKFGSTANADVQFSIGIEQLGGSSVLDYSLVVEDNSFDFPGLGDSQTFSVAGGLIETGFTNLLAPGLYQVEINQSSEVQGFLTKPVPQPSMAALLGLGLLSVFAARRRKA